MFTPGNVNVGWTVISCIAIEAVQRDAIKVQQGRRAEAIPLSGGYRLINTLDNCIKLLETVCGLTLCYFKLILNEGWWG